MTNSRSLPAKSFINNQIDCKIKIKTNIKKTLKNVFKNVVNMYLSSIFKLDYSLK